MDVLVEVERSGLVESRHRGAIVRVDEVGDPVWSIGDPDAVIFPRSANKPFQAVGMVRAGLDLEPRLLALAAASHSAEAVHLEGVREILAGAGLDEQALQTPPSYPLDKKEHAQLLREGGERAPIRMDCSGKHAAMLATSVANGWSPQTYLDPGHPVQRAIAETFADLVGEPDVVGTDGCGAPLFATSLVRLAAGVARLMNASDGTAEARVREAMTAHPQMVSGSRRPERALVAALPGTVAKSGAESVLIVGLDDGTALAAKIEDGSDRALFVAMHRALELAGRDADLLRERPPVLGGGLRVGELRPAF